MLFVSKTNVTLVCNITGQDSGYQMEVLQQNCFF